jgi:ABC-2 type transport system permease protein
MEETMRLALKTVYTIWLREAKTFVREKFRVVAMIAQPLLYLAVLGNGISSGVTLNGSGGINYLTFMYPGVIGMSILFTSIFSAVSIIWDREFGFLKEVLVAPVPRWAVALGKAFGGATIAIVQATILILIAPIIGIHLSPGIIVEMWIMAFLIGVALTSLGIAIAARMSSMQGFQMIINFLIMPLYFLSGAMFPLSSAPAWIKALMTVNPLTYFVDGLRNILFSETKMGNGALVGRTVVEVATRAGLIRWSLIFDLAVVSLVAVVLTAAGAYRFSNQAE